MLRKQYLNIATSSASKVSGVIKNGSFSGILKRALEKSNAVNSERFYGALSVLDTEVTPSCIV
jgi:hypothetical protein